MVTHQCYKRNDIEQKVIWGPAVFHMPLRNSIKKELIPLFDYKISNHQSWTPSFSRFLYSKEKYVRLIILSSHFLIHLALQIERDHSRVSTWFQIFHYITIKLGNYRICPSAKLLVIHKEPNRNSNDKLIWNQTGIDLNTRKRSVLSGETVFGL